MGFFTGFRLAFPQLCELYNMGQGVSVLLHGPSPHGEVFSGQCEGISFPLEARALKTGRERLMWSLKYLFYV